ncbi:OmpA/MotB family protein [Falsiroseomonas stagni]|nr:hypothetical protein [Falsiroseomonas stagni]
MVGLLFVFILILLAFAMQLRAAETAVETERSLLVEQDQIRRGLAGQIAEIDAQRIQLQAERERSDAAMQALEQRYRDLEQTQLLRMQELALARQQLERQLAVVRADVRTELSAEIFRLEQDLTRAQSKREELLRQLERTLRERGITVSVDVTSGVLRLADGVLFATGQSDLPATGAARERLRAIADVFAAAIPCYTASGVTQPNCQPGGAPIIDSVFIEGHTDRRRFGAGERDGNYGLSAARALNTYGAIQSARPELWALRNGDGMPIFGVSGYGPDRPVPGREADREEDYAANRRIEIRFLLAAPTPPEFGALRVRLERLLRGSSQ